MRRVSIEPLVMKFGGTSVGSLERIRAVAGRVLAAQAGGAAPVVVVSAMAGETDRLLGLARALSGAPDPGETDVLLSTGEQQAAAMLALAIQARGGRARSFVAAQLAIKTEGPHGEARVRSIDPSPLWRAVRRGEIPVVAGFQGVTEKGRLTTLGRGGSDTTAVAVAAALGAPTCEIFTDVDGVYTADPGLVPEAERLDEVSYDRMQTLADRGAKVLHARCVALARRHGIQLRVCSSFSAGSGTRVVAEREIADSIRPAVTSDRNVVRGKLEGGSRGGLTLTARRSDVALIEAAFAARVVQGGALAAVSLVGGDAGEPRRAAAAIEALAQAGITVRELALDGASLTVWVDEKDATAAVRLLHGAVNE